jgi:type II secretory pathway component PulF
MTAARTPADDRSLRLSESDAETVAVYVAELTAADLPLAPGLRAASDEVGGRVGHALRSMAERMEQGRTVEELLADPSTGFPHYLQGLVRAAMRTGRLGETLIDLVAHRRAAREQWRSVTAAVAYPAVLLGCALVAFLALSAFVAPILRDLMTDFALTLPLTSRWVIALGEYVGQASVGGLALLLMICFLARLVLGAALWRRLVAGFPFFGPLWHWSGVAEMSRLMAALVQHRVPLPDALRLSADAVRDANVADICRTLAGEVEQGRDLATLVVVTPRLPTSMAPLLRWGQGAARLDEAFVSCAEMLEGRVRMRAALLRSILPPFVFIITAMLAVALFLGYVAPLVTLIQNLT